MNRTNSLIVSVIIAAACAGTAFGQLSKVDTLLQQDGYQLQAASESGAAFYYNGQTIADNGRQVQGYTPANYTAPSWAGSAIFTDSDGMPITGPWAIWNVDVGDLPDQVAGDVPHLGNLVSMAIGDEQYWESNSSVEATVVSEFQYVNADSNYNHTIVYTNNFIGQNQLDGAGVSSFIQQAHPDMLTFDWYPFTTGNATTTDDSQILNTPFDSWYTEMRFYRDVTLDNSYQSSNPTYGVDWGLYRQTYASNDGTRTPNGTEYALETFTAMAFNAKYQSDFLFNGSASQLFVPGPGGTQLATTALYDAVQHVNQEATNLGRTMVYLTPMDVNPDLSWAAGTPDILFLRGQQVSGNGTTPNTLPNGFQPNSTNGSLESTYVSGYNVSQPWTTNANDPWMTGFGQANIGGKVGQFINASGKAQAATGDALISWFRPLGETKQQVMDPTSADYGDIYFMIVNALSTPTNTPSDCLQDIHLDFSAWPLAPGETIPSIQYVDPTTGQIVTVYEDQTGMTVTNATIEPAGTVLLTNTSGKDNNPAGTKLRLNVFLNGGEAFLFKFNNGTAFAVPEPGAFAMTGIAALGFIRRRRSK